MYLLKMGIISFLFVTVIESHPDNFHEDLRLDYPFKGLQEYCDSLNLETMDKKVTGCMKIFQYSSYSLRTKSCT